MIRLFAAASVALAIFAAPRPSLGAPFCVQSQSVPPQCIYVDAASCAKRAGQLGGSCTANPNELQITSGFTEYCVLDNTRIAQCIYSSLDSCSAEASRRHGICVRAPRKPGPGQASDPFEQIRP